jgi:hypothetical protein
MEQFSTNGYSERIKKIWQEQLNELQFRLVNETFYEGELTMSDIEEIEAHLPENDYQQYLKIFFTLKGGGKEKMAPELNKIYGKTKNNFDLPPVLRKNFGIELDGDKNCFVFCFYINKSHFSFEILKELAQEELKKIQEKLKQIQ